MQNDFETISERIHDADSQQNEIMVHWLQAFLMDKISHEELVETFKEAYDRQEPIDFPWKKK